MIQVKMSALHMVTSHFYHDMLLNVDGDPYIKPSVVGDFLLVVCS